jgi:predicted phosphodiesterase
MARLLLCSDIHKNVSAVGQMREQEQRNHFDAVVVAGDIGSKKAGETFQVLSSFGCPVLYVYGNWDTDLEYYVDLGPNSHHLHLSPFQCGELTFVGFSGCPTAWGKNPINARLSLQVEAKHNATLEAVRRGEELLAAASASASEECETQLSLLRSEARARGRKPSERAIRSIVAKRDKALAQVDKQKDALTASSAYQSYSNDLDTAWSDSLRENRRALADVIKDRQLVPDRTVVVTHERLSKASAEFAGVGVFVFGHRHAFSNTTFKGSRYLNVAALDKRVLVQPVRGTRIPEAYISPPDQPVDEMYRQSGWRNVNEGGYVTATWTSERGLEATHIPLQLPSNWRLYWQPVDGFLAPGAPLLHFK